MPSLRRHRPIQASPVDLRVAARRGEPARPRIGPADAGQLVRTRCRPIGHPQAMLVIRVQGPEQHLAIENREGFVIEPRRPPADEPMRARRRSIGHPQALDAARVGAPEQHLVIEDSKSLRGEPGSPNCPRTRAADIQLVRARRCPVGHPQSDLTVRVVTGKQCLAVEDRKGRASPGQTARIDRWGAF